MTLAADSYVKVSPEYICRGGYGFAVSRTFSGCGTARCRCPNEFPLSGRDIAHRFRCLMHPRDDASVGSMLSASVLIGKAAIIDSCVVTIYSDMISSVYCFRSRGISFT